MEAADIAQVNNLIEFHPSLEQVQAVCSRTASNTSSMLQDMKMGRTTEIDSITGILLQEARQAGISIPAHETLYNLVKAKQSEFSTVQD